MRVFVSSQAVDRAPASLLIARLRARGWAVGHSPSNPLDAPDPRWRDWYQWGLAEALDSVEAFIAVIDEAWDSSTWMAAEAEAAAARRGGRTARLCSWNPGGVEVLAAGMRGYLGTVLPPELEAAVAAVEGAGAEPGAGRDRGPSGAFHGS